VHVRPVSRRARHAAALLALAVTAGFLLAAQPLRSAWWTGHDFDTVYAASALTLFRGDRSTFYDHPGVPLQELLAAALTVDWAVSDPGTSRDALADRYLSDLDRMRPYLRVFGALLFVGSALIAYAAVAWSARSVLAGFLAGLVLLASPDATVWAAVVKPDPLLAALSVAAVALLVEGARRRAGALYLAAAALIGFAVTVKVHALGLLAPYGVAVLVWPPRSSGVEEIREFERRHRRTLAVSAAVFAAVALVLNALSALPAARPLALLVAAVIALAAAFGAAWYVARGTRLRPWVELAAGTAAAGLAGAVVPNLLYASLPAPTLRGLAVTASGRGVEASSSFASPFDVLSPWSALFLLAAVGLVLALRSGDWPALLWAVGVGAMGGLALLRYGSIHYYTAAVALLAPLAAPALRPLARAPALLAVVFLVALYHPLELQVDEARDRGTIAEATERANEWVEARLQPGEVALTYLEADDARTFALVRQYAPSTPPRRYRFLPATARGVEYAAENGLDVRYVITGSPADPAALLASLGVEGRAVPADAPGFVYRVDG
jgi:hypothetical protein